LQIPDFLRLFHSNDPTAALECRKWTLTLLRDGLRDGLDASVVLDKTRAFKLVMSFAGSGILCDGHTRLLTLEALASAVAVPKAARELVRNQGLALWLASAASTASSRAEADSLAAVVASCWDTLSNPRRGEEATPLWAQHDVLLAASALRTKAKVLLSDKTLEMLLNLEAAILHRRPQPSLPLESLTTEEE
jgi:hypothetical protein